MNIQNEIEKLRQGYEDSLRDALDEDTRKKVGAILDILEIGASNIAHAKLILHICEDAMERRSLAFGSKRDG